MQVEYLDGDTESVGFISRAGVARVTYANGDVYEGPFDDRRLKHGCNATYTFAGTGDEEAPANVYKGEYTDGERTGTGSMTFSDGSRYRGEWVKGFRQGMGSYTYQNGDIYSGEWKNSKRCGKGTYLHQASGCRLDATWEEGAPVSGVFAHPDGTTYSGKFDGHKFTGDFCLRFPSGIAIQGEFFEREDQSRWRPSDMASNKPVADPVIDRLIDEGKFP